MEVGERESELKTSPNKNMEEQATFIDEHSDWASGLQFLDHASEMEAAQKLVAEKTTEEVLAQEREKLQLLEKMIVPFLKMLRDKGGSSEVLQIRWPNRKEQINAQIEKIQKLTQPTN